MAKVVTQPNGTASLVDIYNINNSYIPTKDTLVLLSTKGGTTVVSTVSSLLMFPKIFENTLQGTYCNSETHLYKDTIPLRG